MKYAVESPQSKICYPNSVEKVNRRRKGGRGGGGDTMRSMVEYSLTDLMNKGLYRTKKVLPPIQH
jgi:hypothetical protein